MEIAIPRTEVDHFDRFQEVQTTCSVFIIRSPSFVVFGLYRIVDFQKYYRKHQLAAER